jgi:hypothetical protein
MEPIFATEEEVRKDLEEFERLHATEGGTEAATEAGTPMTPRRFAQAALALYLEGHIVAIKDSDGAVRWSVKPS